MKRTIPYLVFAAAYAGLLCLLVSAISFLTASDTVVPAILYAPLLAAPLALLLASRVGALTSFGVGLTSLILVICVLTPVTFLLASFAADVLSHPSLAFMAGGLVFFVKFGVFLLWLCGLAIVLVALLYSLLFQRFGRLKHA